jgi:hypothetical protein
MKKHVTFCLFALTVIAAATTTILGMALPASKCGGMGVCGALGMNPANLTLVAVLTVVAGVFTAVLAATIATGSDMKRYKIKETA